MRRIVWVGSVVLIAGVVVAGTLGLGGRGGGPEPAAPLADTTVKVVKGTLVNATSADGELDYGAETPITMKATGVVTWLPAEGTVVGRGDALMRINDRPVVLLFGDLPAYRDLAEATAPPAEDGAPPPPPVQPFTGRDVEQFETNLAALGYSGFTVDKTFNAQTATAVKKWQKHVGLPETGAVGVADVYYAASPVRVSKSLVRLGAAASGDLVSTTGTTRSVQLTVPLADAAWAVAGTAVTVTLPDGKSVAGTVTSATQAQPTDGTQAAGGGSAPPGVQVLVGIADQSTLGTLARSQVTVKHVVDERKDVLSVPVAALLALAEGGYGLEVVDGTSTHTAAVQTGLFADGRVEVSGAGITEGSVVRVAQ
jgi:peptidoglycan hydrolase-like protein with peptidoglycan-binding domain